MQLLSASRRVLWIVVIAASVALLTAGLAAASETSRYNEAERSTLSSSEVEAYMSDFKVDRSTAEENLEMQRRGAGIVEYLKHVLGDSYAGVWYDNSSGKFVVPLTEAVTPSDTRQALADLDLAESVRFAPAKTSWKTLENTEHKVQLRLAAGGVDGRYATTHIDPKTNSVVINEAKAAPFSARSVAQSAAQTDLGAPIEVRERDDRNLELELTACETTAPRACDLPLRGGVEIGPVVSNGFEEVHTPGMCSAGFKAIGNVFGNRFILTAGHCIDGWQGAWGSDTVSYFLPKLAIGTPEEWVFGSNGDWGKIKANGSSYDTNPWPSQVAHYWANQNYPISYEAWAYVGEYLCLSGQRSGTSCGNVSETRVTGLEAEGDPLPPETFVPGVCIDHGDSGGSVYSFSSNTAVGIASAAIIEPTCAASTMAFGEITDATTQLGVTVGSRIGGPPVATTAAPQNIQGTQATATATVNANQVPTEYHFEYGLSTAYGSVAPVPDGDAGHGGPVGVNAVLANLEPATIYHYRVIATSPAGTSIGSDVEFETGPGAPVVVTGGTTARTLTGATLQATVNPRKAATTYQFEYGPTQSYGSSVPVPAANVGSGKTPVAVSQSIAGGLPEHTYHYRIVASNSLGTVSGADRSFTTLANQPTYASSFGSTGSGNGQFNRPLAMAADAPGGVLSGNIWVVDRNNNRVQKFNAKGEYLAQFGSFGSGNGQFIEPRGIAVDGEGNLWIADAGNHRVEKFSSSGAYLAQIVREDVHLGPAVTYNLEIPSGIAVGREGHLFVSDQGNEGEVDELRTTPNGNGSYAVQEYSVFTTPANMATDGNGDVWVADTAQNTIYEIPVASAAAPVARFGTVGSGPGQLSSPYALAVKPSGNLLISDRGNSRVQQFSPAGEFLAEFGKAGSEAGQFCEPGGVALSSRGVIFVADTCHDKVQRWSQKAAPEAVTQPATNVAASGATLNARVNPSGLTTTYRFEYGKTTAYGSSVPVPDASLGASFEDAAVAVPVSGLTYETTYHRRIVATNSEGTTYGGDRTFVTTNAPSYASSFGSFGSGNGQFNRPLAMAADAPGGVPSGNIWVVDKSNNRIQKFNAKGEYLSQFGSFGSGNGQFNEPRGIAVDGAGNIWIADAGNHRVEKFSSSGAYLAQIVREDVQQGPGVTYNLEIPSGIAVGREGHIFVSDQGNSGKVDELRTTPNSGGSYAVREYSVFTTPANMATDGEGDVWVVDTAQNTIYEIPVTSAAEPVARFGTAGSGPGQLSAPYAVAVKSTGNLLISDRGNNRIEQFSQAGTFQLQFGSAGAGAGQFSEPSGLALGSDGSVFIADAGNNRIQKWIFK